MQHPDTAVCVAAMELARDHSPPFLFNHVMRTFGFGRDAGALQGAQCDQEIAFPRLGPARPGFNGPLRARGAVRDRRCGCSRRFPVEAGLPRPKIAVIWDPIALHTTLGVPQRKQPEIALLQLGAGIDVGAIPRSLVTPESMEIILAEYPLLGFKQAFLAAMGAVVRRKPTSGAINLMGEVGLSRRAC